MNLWGSTFSSVTPLLCLGPAASLQWKSILEPGTLLLCSAVASPVFLTKIKRWHCLWSHNIVGWSFPMQLCWIGRRSLWELGNDFELRLVTTRVLCFHRTGARVWHWLTNLVHHIPYEVVSCRCPLCKGHVPTLPGCSLLSRFRRINTWQWCGPEITAVVFQAGRFPTAFQLWTGKQLIRMIFMTDTTAALR